MGALLIDNIQVMENIRSNQSVNDQLSKEGEREYGVRVEGVRRRVRAASPSAAVEKLKADLEKEGLIKEEKKEKKDK